MIILFSLHDCPRLLYRFSNHHTSIVCFYCPHPGLDSTRITLNLSTPRFSLLSSSFTGSYFSRLPLAYVSWNGPLNSRHQHRYYQIEPLLRCKGSLGEYGAFKIPVAFVVSWGTSVPIVSHGKGSYHQNGLNFLYLVQDCAFSL
jgi:hypothetical protein